MSLPDNLASPLKISLFGPFEVRVNGAPLPRLRTRKGQWLLALLTLRHGREVSRDWLAGLLWPDSPNAQALANLRMSLADLRQALGVEVARLRSSTTQVLDLDLRDAEVDVIDFDEAIAQGVGPSLERAVDLYRGPLLEGCTEEWVFQERQIREHAYLCALETLGRQALERDDTRAAEDYLRRAVTLDPLRESAQRALMRVLAAGGNYAAAMLTYRELRLRLHSELSADPDPDTTGLFRQLRDEARTRASRSISLTGHPAGPGEHGRPDLIYSDSRPKSAGLGCSVAASLLAPLSPRRSNLPAQLTPLVGRANEVAAVRDLLQHPDVRLVTLTGPGGVGKTRLGLQVADEMQDDFRDGVTFASLAPVTDAALVINSIMQALGVQETDGQEPLASLKSFLGIRETLLLLDNFEQALSAAVVVAELLAAAPRLKVLVTSRAVLHVRGEQEFPVPPLSAPDPAQQLPAEVLSRYAAVELFVQRAANIRPDFALAADDAPAVARICHQLDGLPLAIELAAAQTRLFSTQALLARLGSRLKLLTGGARDLPARQQTLRATLGWSYDLLNEGEKQLFRRLSVFAGGCSLEAARTVCDPGSNLDVEVLRGLGGLVSQSLLRQNEAVIGEPRFWMLETIREYARERLQESGEADILRREHARFFTELVERAEPELWGLDQTAWLDRLQAEHDNLRVALEWCTTEASIPDFGLRLAGTLWRFWLVRGHWQEGRQWLLELLARGPSTARSGLCGAWRAKALAACGDLARRQADYEQATRLLAESLDLFRELEDQTGTAWSLNRLAVVAWRTGENERALVLAEEGLALFRELRDKRGIAYSLYVLGCIAWRQADYTPAAMLLEESLTLFRELQDRTGMIWSLNRLGAVLWHKEENERAVALVEEGLVLARESGNMMSIATALNSLGEFSQHQGNYDEAMSFHRQSLSIFRELGGKAGIVEGLEQLGKVAAAQERLERAARLLGAATTLRKVISAPSAPPGHFDDEGPTAALRVRLTDQVYAAAWKEGQAMAWDQAVAYALEKDSTAGSAHP